MKIYTSYHGQRTKLEKAGLTVISISRYKPQFLNPDVTWRYKECLMLAPKGNMFRLNKEKYQHRFKVEVLGIINPEAVYNELKEMSEEKDIALVCFEKDREACHRVMVARWLEASLGIEVHEFGAVPSKNLPSAQKSLF